MIMFASSKLYKGIISTHLVISGKLTNPNKKLQVEKFCDLASLKPIIIQLLLKSFHRKKKIFDA